MCKSIKMDSKRRQNEAGKVRQRNLRLNRRGLAWCKILICRTINYAIVNHRSAFRARVRRLADATAGRLRTRKFWDLAIQFTSVAHSIIGAMGRSSGMNQGLRLGEAKSALERVIRRRAGLYRLVPAIAAHKPAIRDFNMGASRLTFLTKNKAIKLLKIKGSVAESDKTIPISGTSPLRALNLLFEAGAPNRASLF
jgi:hypothetical protein